MWFIDCFAEINICLCYFLFVCVYLVPVDSAGSDSVAGRSNSAAAGSAGSGSTDHYTAASDCHYCGPEPGLKHTLFSSLFSWTILGFGNIMDFHTQKERECCPINYNEHSLCSR